MNRLSSALFYVRSVYISSNILRAYYSFTHRRHFVRFASLLSRRVALRRVLCEVRTKYLYVGGGIARRHNIKALIKYRPATLFFFIKIGL
jgi:hypothetical protein